jgi:hypothetical protein
VCYRRQLYGPYSAIRGFVAGPAPVVSRAEPTRRTSILSVGTSGRAVRADSSIGPDRLGEQVEERERLRVVKI